MSRRRRFFRPGVAADVDDELASHLELRERDLVARGFSPDEAQTAARRGFGDVSAIARECRAIDEAWHAEQRRTRMWTDLRQDLSYGFRLLARAPGFTAVAIVTLALGIGGSAAIFSVVDAAILRPLPYPNPHELVGILVELRNPDGTMVAVDPSLDEVDAWRHDGSLFSHVAVGDEIRPVVVDGPEPERVRGYELSQDYLALHGVVPALGRDFRREEFRYGGDAVVMLGHGYWLRRFGGDRHVVGGTIRIAGVPTTVVGVLPRDFYADTPIFVPYRQNALMASRRGTGNAVTARLRSGVTIQEAVHRLRDLTVARDLALGRQTAHGIRITSLHDSATRDAWSTTNILIAAVLAILLIACINVAGLLLARGAGRTAELAIRGSLGAGRFRLVRQLLAESLVLALAGGATGVLLAWISLDVLVANIPLSLPENVTPAVTPRALTFTAGLSMATGVLFGLAPALKLSRANVSIGLVHTSRIGGHALSRRGGQVLIAAEVALAIVLLAGAGLMIRSFALLTSVDVGFDPDAVVTMEVVPVSQAPADMKTYYPAVMERIRELPGVEEAGAVDHLPLAGSSTMTSGSIDGQRVSVNVREYLPGYFEAIGFSLREGVLPAASSSAALPVAVVNEGAVRQWFGGGPALGRRLEIGQQRYEIAAVVRDLRHRGPLSAPMPEVWVPFASRDPKEVRPMTVVVRTAAGAAALNAHLRQAAHSTATRAVVTRIRQGSDWFSDRVLGPRRRTVLFGLLGALGLGLTLVGIAGVTAYAVAQRTQEIGVRMALGARAGQVVAAILRDALWPAIIGIAVGLGLANLCTRVIATFLFETTPTDPLTLGAVALTMALAATAAATVPARRAAAVDPVAALRAN